jgi:hypothetical protein
MVAIIPLIAWRAQQSKLIRFSESCSFYSQITGMLSTVLFLDDITAPIVFFEKRNYGADDLG